MTESEQPYFAHSHALVETTDIGNGTTIWAFVHVLPGATIGANCNICDHCFIEGGAIIGNNVTLKCGIYLWKGITIQDKVFLGPNVVFTNDVRPRSKNANFLLKPTLVKYGASLGANTTVLAGVTIGRYALTGIGSVITRDVKDYALVYGNPGRQRGWVDELGEKMRFDAEMNCWYSSEGNKYFETANGLKLVVDA